MIYRNSSRDYLRRAQALLLAEDCAHLFYGAFELRAAIEARMQEYLETAEHISEKKRQGWRIAELAKNIESAFAVGDRIVKLTIEGLEACQRCVIYHTPVTQKLQKHGQLLGNYLHALKVPRSPEDPWWTSFKSLLVDTNVMLSAATKGTLLGPPLLGPDGKSFKIHHELEIDSKIDAVMRNLSGVKGEIRMCIDYLEDLPASLP